MPNYQSNPIDNMICKSNPIIIDNIRRLNIDSCNFFIDIWLSSIRLDWYPWYGNYIFIYTTRGALASLQIARFWGVPRFTSLKSIRLDVVGTNMYNFYK